MSKLLTRKEKNKTLQQKFPSAAVERAAEKLSEATAGRNCAGGENKHAGTGCAHIVTTGEAQTDLLPHR